MRIWLALAAVWLIWGSTYMVIAVAVEELPPLLLAGGRFLLAGALLVGVTARAVPRDLHAWAWALLAGALMVLCGNAMVCLAETEVSSGLVALVMATAPSLIVLGAWLTGGERPGHRVLLGLAIGFFGILLLVGAPSVPHPGWVALLLFAAVCWAGGSLVLRVPALARHGGASVGMAYVCGGALTLALALGLGQRVGEVSVRAWSAAAYLLVFGSLVAGSAYGWLLRNAPVRLASSYAYGCALVALALGAVVLDEPIGPRVLAAAAVVLAGVVLVVAGPAPVSSGRGPSSQPEQAPDAGGAPPGRHPHAGGVRAREDAPARRPRAAAG